MCGSHGSLMGVESTTEHAPSAGKVSLMYLCSSWQCLAAHGRGPESVGLISASSRVSVSANLGQFCREVGGASNA